MIPIERLSTLLSEESDRGVVVLGFALVEERLLELCVSKLSHGSEKKRDDLLRHLDSMAARTLLAQCAGWLSQDECDLIDCVRKIRNHVAHNPTDGLNEPKVRGHLSNPKWQFTVGVVTERDKVLVLTAMAHAVIDAAILNTSTVSVVGDGTDLVEPALMSNESYGGLRWPPS